MALAFVGLGGVVPGEAARNQSDSFTVIIDAGHGGHDTGAVDNGAREKDINLGVARKLAAMLESKMKNTNVVMTRDDDTFVSLQERANIANRNKGDLFVSIHTNSLDRDVPTRKSAKGTSVYVLGLHKDDSNLKVARRENAVIELEDGYEQKYSGFDPNKDESYIIFEMSQKKSLGQSLRFAKAAQQELVGTAGRHNRGVKQAGFWVLWSTSMPSVLVELDFICNPESARYLTSENGQKKLAQALFNAIEDFGKQDLARKASINGTPTRQSKARRKSKGSSQQSRETAQPVEARQEQASDVPVLVTSTNKAPREEKSHKETRSSNGVSYSQYRRMSQTGSRRRRSASAKAVSDARTIDDKRIIVKNENDNLARTIKSAADKPVEIAATDEGRGNYSKNRKNKKAASRSATSPSEKQDKKQDKNKNQKDNNKNKDKSRNTRIIVKGNSQTAVSTDNGGKTKITVKTNGARKHTSLAGKNK